MKSLFGKLGRLIWFVVRYVVVGLLAVGAIAAICIALAVPTFGTATTIERGVEAARATGIWLIAGLLLACAAAFLPFVTELTKAQKEG